MRLLQKLQGICRTCHRMCKSLSTPHECCLLVLCKSPMLLLQLLMPLFLAKAASLHKPYVTTQPTIFVKSSDRFENRQKCLVGICMIQYKYAPLKLGQSGFSSVVGPATPFYEILITLIEFRVNIILIWHMNMLFMFEICDNDYVHMIYLGATR